MNKSTCGFGGVWSIKWWPFHPWMNYSPPQNVLWKKMYYNDHDCITKCNQEHFSPSHPFNIIHITCRNLWSEVLYYPEATWSNIYHNNLNKTRGSIWGSSVCHTGRTLLRASRHPSEVASNIVCTHRSSKYVSSASKPFCSDRVTKGIADNLYSSCMKLQFLQETALSNGYL